MIHIEIGNAEYIYNPDADTQEVTVEYIEQIGAPTAWEHTVYLYDGKGKEYLNPTASMANERSIATACMITFAKNAGIFTYLFGFDHFGFEEDDSYENLRRDLGLFEDDPVTNTLRERDAQYLLLKMQEYQSKFPYRCAANDLTFMRLEWLTWWVTWAVNECDNPCIRVT